MDVIWRIFKPSKTHYFNTSLDNIRFLFAPFSFRFKSRENSHKDEIWGQNPFIPFHKIADFSFKKRHLCLAKHEVGFAMSLCSWNPDSSVRSKWSVAWSPWSSVMPAFPCPGPHSYLGPGWHYTGVGHGEVVPAWLWGNLAIVSPEGLHEGGGISLQMTSGQKRLWLQIE